MSFEERIYRLAKKDESIAKLAESMLHRLQASPVKSLEEMPRQREALDQLLRATQNLLDRSAPADD